AAEIIDIVMAHRPRLTERRARKAPPPHTFLIGIAGEDRIRLQPLGFTQCRAPDRLTFGPHNAIGPILLQLLAVSGINQRVIRVGPDFQNDRQAFVRQRLCATRQPGWDRLGILLGAMDSALLFRMLLIARTLYLRLKL